MVGRVAETIRRYAMFEPRETVVVAVSGGPDSVALLFVLRQLNIELCLEICVAHFDHGIRRASRRDYLFVENLASSLGYSFTGARMSRAVLRKKGSLEDRLRRARYDFLLKVCRRRGASKLVLGHTLDDQAETVLMRIIRGSGLYGLSAILPKRRLSGVEVVRPLIEVSRAEVAEFLKKRKFAFRTDETNFEERFLRNRIRAGLLPYLAKRYNPKIREVLAGLALTVGADYEWLAVKGSEFLTKHLSRDLLRCRIPLEKFKVLPPALRRVVLRLMIEAFKGDLRQLSLRHILEVEEMLQQAAPKNLSVALPGDILVTASAHFLNISFARPKDNLLLKRVSL